ncbi:MAG: phosphate ABC transporter permease PstA, partial [Candidatus Hydrogenedentota bacterium]
MTMRLRSATPRLAVDATVKVLSGLSACAGIAILAWILWEVGRRGIGSIERSFFFELPTPPGMGGGGVGNCILGTLMITGLATAIGVPIGIFAGIYLAEYDEHSRLASAARFVSSVLMGMPSIIVGVFVYTLVVVPFGHFSGYAGSLALAIMMLPIVTRTTEDMLRLVPNTLRESALALGAPRWRVTLQIVFRSARPGPSQASRRRPGRPMPGFGRSATLAGMDLLARITIDPEQCGGRPCIRGLRIRVTDVLELLAAGESQEQILAQYPYLEREDILASLEYAAQSVNHP